jgi:KaiC/GvpD/RAD55 family RecA-like ATPase
VTIGETYGRIDPPSSGSVPKSEPIGYLGVEGIDALLPQGLTYDTQIMLVGDTGIGKSVLSAQFLYEGLLVGDTCIYIACDEPLNQMRLQMARFRLGTIAYERTGQLIMVDAYGRDLSQEARVISDPSNLDEFLLVQQQIIREAKGNQRPMRLVVDSLSTILLTHSFADIIEFNSHRLRSLRSQKILTLDNIVNVVLDERVMAGLEHTYPLILRMFYRANEGIIHRYFQMGKLKSGMFSAREHLFSIDPRTGVTIH